MTDLYQTVIEVKINNKWFYNGTSVLPRVLTFSEYMKFVNIPLRSFPNDTSPITKSELNRINKPKLTWLVRDELVEIKDWLLLFINNNKLEDPHNHKEWLEDLLSPSEYKNDVRWIFGFDHEK